MCPSRLEQKEESPRCEVWGKKCQSRQQVRAVGGGVEMVSLRERQEAELEMLRFSLGVTRIRNEFIRGTAHVLEIRREID